MPAVRPRLAACVLALLATMGIWSAAGRATATAPATARASPTPASVTASLRADLSNYLTARMTAEHISAVSLSVSFRRHRPSISLAVGTTRYGGGPPVSANSLWQIGSNTKAFTSVLMLKLEAEHKLSINDTLGKWLPQYRAWRHVTIKRLLNMTSGIPDYLGVPAFLRAYAAAPNTIFSPSRLVSYAVGRRLLKGWNYSNTDYILAQMIIARATHSTYAGQLQRRIIKPLRLPSLFYCTDRCPPRVTARQPDSYFFDSTIPQLGSLMGKNQRGRNLSYAQGAGAIVSSLPDMNTWLRALYGGRMLPRQQQRQLTSLVSQTTGKPIPVTTPTDPRGFGLGVAQSAGGIGTFWDYEGETLSYRVLHLYVPSSGVVVTLGTNSATSNDQLGQLVGVVYETLLNDGLA